MIISVKGTYSSPVCRENTTPVSEVNRTHRDTEKALVLRAKGWCEDTPQLPMNWRSKSRNTSVKCHKTITVDHMPCLVHSSHSSWKTKFPVFSLYFPCLISVFPVYFHYKTSNITSLASYNNFFLLYLVSCYWISLIIFSKFPVFFQNF